MDNVFGNNPRPLFMMLVGLPGVGKSTYREDSDFGTFIHISTDDIVDTAAQLQGVTYDDLWEGMIGEATKAAAAKFSAAVKARDSIIWDQTNLTLKKRRGVLAQLPKEYVKIAVYFEIDEELRQQRVAARVGKHIPAYVQDSMIQSYTRPERFEGFDYVLDGVAPLTPAVAAE